MSQETTLLTPQDVARRLHISRATLYRMLDEGRFPRPIRLGERVVRWRESDLAAYLEGLSKPDGASRN